MPDGNFFNICVFIEIFAPIRYYIIALLLVVFFDINVDYLVNDGFNNLGGLYEKTRPGCSPVNHVPHLAEIILIFYLHEKFRSGLQG